MDIDVAATSSAMTPRVCVGSLTFSDGTTVSVNPDDVIVVVGPNNSGKSALLRAIHTYASTGIVASPVVTGVSLTRDGTLDEILAWLETVSMKSGDLLNNPEFVTMGASVHRSNLKSWWTDGAGMHGLARFFIHHIAGESRLLAANPAPAISFTTDAMTHPIHYLYRDDAQEKSLSQQFRRAFGEDLIVHRAAGGEIPLYVGELPVPALGEDRVSHSFVTRLERLSRLETQGDGMRSFAGILLNTAVGRESLLLIDEPEAFLHPPQARLLGRMLVEERPATRQLFIATHSGDVLRGILDASPTTARIIRLQREGDANIATELDPAAIGILWKDPLLRYSNVLDGIFHERVIIAESDSDCRFYAAIADANRVNSTDDVRAPDTMFLHCGGKHRIPLVLSALHGLGVAVEVVTDFDVLSDEQPLRAILEKAGGDWKAIEGDWKQVKQAIDTKKPELSTTEVSEGISKVLDSIKVPVFPAEARKHIQAVLRRSSPWATAKSVGKAFVPSGQPTQACNRLLEYLRTQHIHVVPVGELEGFVRTEGDHGPGWVNAVLSRDLAADPELADARAFVSNFAN